MKLSVWAEETGVSYQVAWRWWRDGKLPVSAYQTPSGAIIVTPPQVGGRIVGYARVSSRDQEADLDRQVARIAQSGNSCAEYVSEVGSALDGARPKLLKLLADSAVTTIVVEHRDRLTRFGFDYIAAALTARGASIIVLDEAELEDDLVRDVSEVLTSLCARLYGRRGATNRARRALQAAEAAT